MYEVYSKSNATDKITRKWLIIHDNVSSLIFWHGYCRLGSTFQRAVTTGGELVFDDNMLDPLQGRLHHLLGQPVDTGQIFSSG